MIQRQGCVRIALGVGGLDDVGGAGDDVELHPVRVGFLVESVRLDGTVDGSDFIAWSTNKFTASLLWSKGNFNADSMVDDLDRLIWDENKFTSSDGGSTTPEPGTGLLLLIAVV